MCHVWYLLWRVQPYTGLILVFLQINSLKDWSWFTSPKSTWGLKNTFLIVNNDILGSKCLSYLIIEIPLSTLCKTVSICILKFAILSRYISRYIWCEALPNDMSVKIYLDELSHIFFLRILLVAQVW